MSNEITFLGVDLDEATVRRVLEILPFVEPVALDELDRSDGADGTREDGRESGSATGDGSSDRARRPSRRTTGSDTASGTGPNSGRTGAGARERARGNPDAGPTVEGAESDTPWPGSPFAATEDEAAGGRNWKRILIAVGLVLGLGVIGVAAVWAYREWTREDGVGGSDGPGGAHSSGPLDAAASAVREDEDADDGATDPAQQESRMPSMDLDPVVGMAFLAGAAVLLKRLADRE